MSECIFLQFSFAGISFRYSGAAYQPLDPSYPSERLSFTSLRTIGFFDLMTDQ